MNKIEFLQKQLKKDWYVQGFNAVPIYLNHNAFSGLAMNLPDRPKTPFIRTLASNSQNAKIKTRNPIRREIKKSIR